MSAAEGAASRVDIVHVAPRLVAIVRRSVRYAEMGDTQRRALPPLDAALRNAGLDAGGPSLTIWRPLGARPTAEAGEVSLCTLPAGRAAHLKLIGSCEDVPASWDRLFAGCEGHARAGLNPEVHTDPIAGHGAAEIDLHVMLV